ncbi:MAG: hypothetical protein JNL52_11275 [Flavobacteriales bacterium]|nr:hypothetical protein [Flavobacteriales bacterium]
MRNFSLLTLLLLTSVSALGQDAAPGWLESTLYGNGKINVVILVVAVIISGIGLWMFSMDRRLRRMEKNLKK